MIPTGSKLWFGVTAFALAAAVAYFAASRGEELGTMVLLALAVAGFTLGVLSALVRDGDPHPDQGGPVTDRQGASAGTAVVAPGRVQLAAAWPAMAAVGAAVIAVGLATGGVLAYVGVVLLVAAGVEWMVQAWAERATDDATANRELRNRLMYPFEIPLLAAAVIGLVVIAFSRVLLAVSKVGSTVVAIVVAALILGAGFLLTSRPKLSSSLLTVVVAVGVIGLLGGGIVGAVVGEREFEVHEGEGNEEEGEGGVEVVVSASNTTDYDEDVLNVPLDQAVTIVFENEQGGVQHNVHIVEPVDFEPGELITGPAATSQVVTFEEAGEYTFVCDVYPEMEGVIEVVDQPADGGEPGQGADFDDLDGDEPDTGGDESEGAGS